MYWLLDETIAQRMRRAEESGLLPTAAQQAEFEEKQAIPSANGDPRGMTRAGTTAEIKIEGVLTKKPDLFAMWFGGGNTAYKNIQAALATAASDPGIKEIVLNVDSFGGSVDGLFETMDALKAFPKKIAVVASNATSAAYGLVAATGSKIHATNPGAMFGSVGVAARYLVVDEIVDVANTESPNKRPDLRTDEGKAAVQKELDEIFDLFVSGIAQGRNTSVADVKENYGRGGTLLAAAAKKTKMIDSFSQTVASKNQGPRAESAGEDLEEQPTPKAEQDAGSKQPTVAKIKESTMSEQKPIANLKELRAAFPVLCDELAAEAKAAGVTEERDRVNAHLEYGKACDAMDIALDAVSSGASMTLTLQAKYNTAGKNKSDKTARQEETDKAAAAAAGADPGSNGVAAEQDLGDQVVALRKSQKVMVK